jgi:hypothetical protein
MIVLHDDAEREYAYGPVQRGAHLVGSDLEKAQRGAGSLPFCDGRQRCIECRG